MNCKLELLRIKNFQIFSLNPKLDNLSRISVSVTHYFDMKDWKDGNVASEFDSKYKKYRVFRKDMTRITLRGYRELMESVWEEFEKKF